MEDNNQSNEVEKLLEEYNKLNMEKEKLQSKKMSRQKLQCTKTYKESLINKRRLQEKRKDLELQLDIVLNRNMTSEDWSERFKTEAQNQLQKNEKDKEKKRISSKTYEKRKRIIYTDYKLKMEELKNIRTEIEEYNINPKLLAGEYNSRITQIDEEIARSENFRKDLRESNNSNNRKIDEKISEMQDKLNEIKSAIEKAKENNSKPSNIEKTKENNSKPSNIDIKFPGLEKPKEKPQFVDIKFPGPKEPREIPDISLPSPENTEEKKDIKLKFEENYDLLREGPGLIVFRTEKRRT